MGRRKLFLRWSLLLSLTAVGALIMAYLGWFGLMYRADVTKLTLVTLAVFLAGSVWAGTLTWRADTVSESGTGRPLKEIEIGIEHGWLAQGLCERLGLLGTLFGFVLTLVNAFQNITTADPKAVQLLLEQVSSGLATAIITTIVGYICSIILWFQYHHLAQAVERMKP